MLTVWDIGPNGEVTKKGEAFAGPVTAATISTLGEHGVVATAVRTTDGNLKIINWAVAANGDITRKGGASAGAVGEIASATLIPGKLATAVRTESGQLKVIVWVVVNDDLDLRRNGDGHFDLLLVDKIAITEMGSDQNSSNFVTAVRGQDGNLHIVTWSETDLS
jgi:hypothetical protein